MPNISKQILINTALNMMASEMEDSSNGAVLEKTIPEMDQEELENLIMEATNRVTAAHKVSMDNIDEEKLMMLFTMFVFAVGIGRELEKEFGKDNDASTD